MDNTLTKFSGNRITIGSIIYMFCSMGFASIYQAGYALFPETYGESVSQVSSALSLLPMFAFIASIAYNSVKKKISVKGMMYLGAVLVALTSGVLFSLSGFVGLVIAFGIYGLHNGFATFTLITELVSNWYVEKRADKVALTIGAHAFGMAFYQFIAGHIFAAMGLRKGYVVIGLGTAVILLLVTKLLIVADTPTKVGQIALGADKITADEQVVVEESTGSGSGLYKNPAFWLSCAARFIGASGVMFIPTYATMYFGEGGMSLSTSATVISVMTLASAFYAMFSGKVLTALKTKGFITLVFVLCAASNAFMLIYGKKPSFLFIILLVIGYSVGNSWSSITNLILDKIFAPEDVANANSKLFAIHYAGNIVSIPVTGILIERAGYDVMWIVLIVVNILALIFYLLALKVAKAK